MERKTINDQTAAYSFLEFQLTLTLPWYESELTLLWTNAFKYLPIRQIVPPITANQVDLVHCITLNPLFKDNFDGWTKHISSTPLQTSFCHAGSYIMEEFEVLMKRRISRKEDIQNAQLIGFEVICCWERTIRLAPAIKQHQK